MKKNTHFTTMFVNTIILLVLFPIIGFSQNPKTPVRVNKSEFVAGTIVIKVIEGIGPFEKQERGIHFDVASLDEKAIKFDVNKLEKRFKHKPIPKNSGLPDLSRIYRIEFPESQNVHQVAKEFAKDPNIEYAEAIPVYHTAEVPDDPMYNQQQHLPPIQVSTPLPFTSPFGMILA